MPTVLVLCTGNICRSPIAEGFLRQLLKERGIGDVTVHSAGVSGLVGYPADPESVRSAAERDIDISEHRARRVNTDMIETADLVLTMTAKQRASANRLVPSAAGRTFTLKEMVFLLERAQREVAGPATDEPLRAAAARAHSVRQTEPALELLDEDVSDPLGLGPDAFRAVVWEVGDLMERFVDNVFLSGEPQPVAERKGGER
jgi:protein-tyrosine-phosphatase